MTYKNVNDFYEIISKNIDQKSDQYALKKTQNKYNGGLRKDAFTKFKFSLCSERGTNIQTILLSPVGRDLWPTELSRRYYAL